MVLIIKKSVIGYKLFFDSGDKKFLFAAQKHLGMSRWEIVCVFPDWSDHQIETLNDWDTLSVEETGNIIDFSSVLLRENVGFYTEENRRWITKIWAMFRAFKEA